MCSCTMLYIYVAAYSTTKRNEVIECYSYNIVRLVCRDTTPASIDASMSLSESLSQLDTGEGQEPRCFDGFVASVWECPLTASRCGGVSAARLVGQRGRQVQRCGSQIVGVKYQVCKDLDDLRTQAKMCQLISFQTSLFQPCNMCPFFPQVRRCLPLWARRCERCISRAMVPGFHRSEWVYNRYLNAAPCQALQFQQETNDSHEAPSMQNWLLNFEEALQPMDWISTTCDHLCSFESILMLVNLSRSDKSTPAQVDADDDCGCQAQQ